MDNPKKLPDSGAAPPLNVDSGQSFGATGLFAAMRESEAPNESSGRFDHPPVLEQSPKPEALHKPQATSPATLAEPVVHRVVLSHANDAPAGDLIDRIRSSAAEREPDQEKATVIGAQGGAAASSNNAPGTDAGNVGLTQLLRSMGLESQTMEAPAKPATGAPPSGSGSSDGFTAMLSSFATPGETVQADVQSRSKIIKAPGAGEPQSSAAAKPESYRFTQQFETTGEASKMFRALPESNVAETPAAQSSPPVTNAPAQIDRQPGEFTRLFNSMGGAAAEVSGPQASRSVPSAAPAREPGGFTQLFNSLGSVDSGSSEPQASRTTPSATPASEPGSFTRMFQSSAPSAASGSEFHESFKSPGEIGRSNQGQFPGLEPAPIHDSLGHEEPEELPFAPTAPSGPRDSVTQLLRRLDSPSITPSAPSAPPPVASAPTGGSGGLTAMFASLDEPSDSGGKTGAPSDRTAQQPPQGVGGAPAWSGASSVTEMNQRTAPAAPPPPVSSGPSEFTRILDASRIREMGLRGGQGAGAPPAPAVPAQAPAAPPMPAAPRMQMPNYAPPAAPQMGAVPGMAAGAHPGAMPPSGAGMAQVPGAHVPAVAAPTVPQPPALKPPAGGMGKLQQYVPLLLILIIFLLVGLLVTVVFLLKK